MNYFTLPSQYEGFPFVTLEAQANGLPCLISTGVPESVMLTEHVKRIELEKNKWANFLLQHKREAIHECREKLREQGYDISTSAKIVEKTYIQ